MRVIKFKLTPGWNTIPVEMHCEPLWIEYQHGDFVVWCKEYTVLPAEGPLQLFLAMTGEPLEDNMTYVGTATTPDRTFVVHLFNKR